MSSLVLTLRETLRYRGAIGQWSWVLHRLSGLGVLLFFVIHIIDTSWALFYPGLYEKAIAIYQTPLFTIGEFLLVAAVVYHAYNGLRIVILDYKPQWWRFQERAAWWVLGLTALTLVPVFALMFAHVLDYYNANPTILGLDVVLETQLPFVVGIVLAFVVSIILSSLIGLFSGDSGAQKTTASKGGSRSERFWWSYMRISGLLIVPLVFGHLAMMHVVQGVFDLTVAGKSVVGVTATSDALIGNAINDTGTAVEFVGERWNYLVASIAVWRFYDFALLVLASVHGFNGLRYVLTDYTMSNPMLRRASIYVSIMGGAIMIVVGGGALIGTIDNSAVRIALESRVELGLEVREAEGVERSPFLEEMLNEIEGGQEAATGPGLDTGADAESDGADADAGASAAVDDAENDDNAVSDDDEADGDDDE